VITRFCFFWISFFSRSSKLSLILEYSQSRLLQNNLVIIWKSFTSKLSTISCWHLIARWRILFRIGYM
jgi:hypothetical protein